MLLLNHSQIDKPVPIIGTIDHYCYAQDAKTILEIFSNRCGELKAFDLELWKLIKTCIRETNISVGHDGKITEEKAKELLAAFRAELFNYAQRFTFEQIRILFHNGTRSMPGYGEFKGLSVIALHRWIKAFEQDENRKIALSIKEKEIEELKAKLEREKRQRYSQKYLIMRAGLISCINMYYQTGSCDKTAFIYFDEFREFGLLLVSEGMWNNAVEKAKNIDTHVYGKDVYGKEMPIIAAFVDQEAIAKRLIFENFIEIAAETNFSILNAYDLKYMEKISREEFPDAPEEDQAFWLRFKNEKVIAAYDHYAKHGKLNGFAGAIYTHLKKIGVLDKLITEDDKRDATNQSQSDQYEHFSELLTRQSPEVTAKILAQIRGLPEKNPQIIYDAKQKILLLFFRKIKTGNIDLKKLLNGQN